MNAIFSQNSYTLKRQGLSIMGKYKLYDLQGKEPLLFIDIKSKWIPPSTAIHVYADEKKKQEVLTLKEQPLGVTEDMDVFDAENGQKIGSLTTDATSVSEIFKDVWSIQDADGKTLGKVYEKSLGKSLLRELVTHDLPQKMDIMIGDIEVGELRQKIRPISYELTVDLTKDVSSLLDHRLAIAAAILIAWHQGNEVD